MLIVGSYALAFRGIQDRIPNDIDIFCTKEEFKILVAKLSEKSSVSELKFKEGGAYVKFQNRTIVDASFLDADSSIACNNRRIDAYCNTPEYVTSIGKARVANPEVVLIMKLSHKYKKDCPHFLKTMKDIISLRNKTYKGRTIPNRVTSELLDILVEREEATYKNSLPKLNTSKKEFFTDSVPYKYDHDTIHEAVKHLDKPAYQYYMKDGEQVMCDMQKFEELPEIVRLYGVLEESYVLALERAIIPFGTDPKRAFDIALSKVCTSITSGKFRAYAWDNYFKVQELYHESFVLKFQTALDQGKILPFNKA